MGLVISVGDGWMTFGLFVTIKVTLETMYTQRGNYSYMKHNQKKYKPICMQHTKNICIFYVLRHHNYRAATS